MGGHGQRELRMTTVTEIKQAILNLPETEYAELMEWLDELEWDEWDRQIESDSKAGKLAFLKAEAEEAKRKGELQEL